MLFVHISRHGTINSDATAEGRMKGLIFLTKPLQSASEAHFVSSIRRTVIRQIQALFVTWRATSISLIRNPISFNHGIRIAR